MSKGLRISTIEIGDELKAGEKRVFQKYMGYSHVTMVFHHLTNGLAWDKKTYPTEAVARLGHKEMLTKWKAFTRKEIRGMLDNFKQNQNH